jgi:uncharacterized membrane protein YdjX (TVP38/TMEM64 family)
MRKKPAIFKRIQRLMDNNPGIVWAVAWVAIFPSLGSFYAIHHLYSHQDVLSQLKFGLADFLTIYVGASSLFMGLAFIPTTLLALISGFLFGWTSFPWLVVAYSLASCIGYMVGIKLDRNSLEFLLKKYPKAAQLIDDKRHKISQLIFFVRLSPVIPFALSNLLFALLKVPLERVIWVGLWGMLPRTLMAFTTGVFADSLMAAIQEKNGMGQILVILGLILISGWGIYKFFRKDNLKSGSSEK